MSSLLQLPVDDSRSNARGPLDLALNFYRLDTQLPCNHVRKALQLPFVTAFEDTVSFSAVCASAMTTSTGHRKIFRDLLVQSLSLLNELVTALALEREMTLVVDWNPSDWLSCLVEALETEVSVVLHPHLPLIYPITCYEGYHVSCCRSSDDFADLTAKRSRTTTGLINRSSTCDI